MAATKLTQPNGENSNEPVIRIENISKSYRQKNLRQKKALDNVSLTVKRGEVFGFLGPNGAGKTSLIKTMVGLMAPDSGHCLIQGLDSQTKQAKLKIGYLPENTYFHNFLTAEEFLLFHGRLLGLRKTELEKKIPMLLELVGLSKHAKERLKTFSKGMRQRIGFAQALIHDPELLILDEPMSGLDPVGRREIRDIINKTALRGKTIFFSTHIIHDVEVICSSVGFILEGKLKGAGNIETLLGKTVKSMEIRFGLPLGKEPSAIGMDQFRKTMDGWVVDIESSADDLERKVNECLVTIISSKGTIRSVVSRKSTLEDLFFSGAK